jgi:hypothetical protein
VVVVKGELDGTNIPRALKERFGIEIDYLSTSSSECVVEIERERAASIYSTHCASLGTV